jgi:acetyl esterase/lipase
VGDGPLMVLAGCVRACVLATTCAGFLVTPVTAQRHQAPVIAAQVAAAWRTVPNLRYGTRHSRARLDLYLPIQSPQRALVVFFHGGAARKEEVSLAVVPFLAAGMAVANVEYRTVEDAPAPAAVHDAVCAVRWLVHAAPSEYKTSESHLILTGNSAGAHLALMAGLANASFGAECSHLKPVRPAAIVNLFGVSDFDRFLYEAPISPAIDWARRWLRGGRKLAREMSPVRYVRAGSPAVLSIHGVDDDLVPLEQSRELHNALEQAGVPNRLVAIPAAGHGGYWTAWPTGQLETVTQAILGFIDGQTPSDAEHKRSKFH